MTINTIFENKMLLFVIMFNKPIDHRNESSESSYVEKKLKLKKNI